MMFIHLPHTLLAEMGAHYARTRRPTPSAAADLIERGICLTGGGSLIQGLDERLRKEGARTRLISVRAPDRISSGHHPC